MKPVFQKVLGPERFERVDRFVAGTMQQYGTPLLRYALAVVFIWFGALKPLGLSPAEELVKHTVYFLPADVFFPILGWWEVAIGVGLLYRPLVRAALFLLFAQMVGTFLPLLIMPEVVWTQFPFALTVEGQYIIKNLVLISAALVVGGTCATSVRRMAAALCALTGALQHSKKKAARGMKREITGYHPLLQPIRSDMIQPSRVPAP